MRPKAPHYLWRQLGMLRVCARVGRPPGERPVLPPLLRLLPCPRRVPRDLQRVQECVSSAKLCCGNLRSLTSKANPCSKWNSTHLCLEDGQAVLLHNGCHRRR